MPRAVTRYLLGAVMFLGSTLVFWGILQTPTEQFDGLLVEAQPPGAGLIQDKLQIQSNPLNLPGRQQHLQAETAAPAGKSYTPKPKSFQFIANGVSEKLRRPKTDRIWPLGRYESQDRIMAQINTVPDNPRLTDKSEQKLILIYNGFPDGISEGRKKFVGDNCPVTNCILTEDRDQIHEADAVVIQSGMHQEPAGPRNPEQIWILFMLESPQNSMDLYNAKGKFNWTATYRLDSTLNTPYERFIPFSSPELQKKRKNYAAGKPKKIAWFVSNCYTNNGRFEYTKELQKHIKVDIYGECGTLHCPRSNKEACYGLLSQDYKFYLAFENSNCKDYITEKFYWNGLSNDVIPIVMGARPEDYAAVAPPHSYIHVDDFDSPKDLANYLYKLDENDDLYNEYFKWKGTGEFIDTKYWCRLCSMVHEAQNSAVSPKDKFSVYYDDIQRWWNGPGVCINPGHGGKPWASWRNVTNKLDQSEVMFYGSWPGS